ncbi:MAG: 30S ribosomal protein S9 [Chitinophagales bacterium]|nr:30S ribosomal protein S9 [Chitinophagales bacterium]
MAERNTTIGRRKEASARITLTAASGDTQIIVNGKDYKVYFPQEIYQKLIEQPMNVAEVVNKYSFTANVRGGGMKGQAEAIRLGISRALVKENEEIRAKLKPLSLLTRDPRSVERKKPGRKKARKRFQFSKR